MKKILLALVMVMTLVLTFGIAGAFNEFPNQPVAEATTGDKILAFPAINLNGVAVFLPEVDGVAIGALTDVATVYNFVNLSVMVATPLTELENENPGVMAGPAIGVNIPALVNKLGGTWISDSIASSVGASYLYDIQDNKFRFGIYGSLVRINVDQLMKKLGLL